MLNYCCSLEKQMLGFSLESFLNCRSIVRKPILHNVWLQQDLGFCFGLFPFIQSVQASFHFYRHSKDWSLHKESTIIFNFLQLKDLTAMFGCASKAFSFGFAVSRSVTTPLLPSSCALGEELWAFPFKSSANCSTQAKEDYSLPPSPMSLCQRDGGPAWQPGAQKQWSSQAQEKCLLPTSQQQLFNRQTLLFQWTLHLVQICFHNQAGKAISMLLGCKHGRHHSKSTHGKLFIPHPETWENCLR